MYTVRHENERVTLWSTCVAVKLDVNGYGNGLVLLLHGRYQVSACAYCTFCCKRYDVSIHHRRYLHCRSIIFCYSIQISNKQTNKQNSLKAETPFHYNRKVCPRRSGTILPWRLVKQLTLWHILLWYREPAVRYGVGGGNFTKISKYASILLSTGRKGD